MKCANCRKFIREDSNDDDDSPVKCEKCGSKAILCPKCFNNSNGLGYIEECFACKLQQQREKFGASFAHIGHGYYATNCDKSEWSYQANTEDDTELCRNLIVDTKFVIRPCIEEYINQLTLEKINACFDVWGNSPLANEIEAIFWLPITTTGLFYESGLIPNMKECIALSIYLENHFKIGLEHQARLAEGGTSNKQKWLCDTFEWLENRVRAKTHRSEFFKNVLSNCRILHYFVIFKSLFPAVDTQNLLERVKCLFDLIREDADPEDKVKFIAPIALYLANIEKEMAVAPRQANPVQPINYNGKNDNNAPY
jgi:DNA-directed RNA polymerase subunit RPC12/RpoP